MEKPFTSACKGRLVWRPLSFVRSQEKPAGMNRRADLRLQHYNLQERPTAGGIAFRVGSFLARTAPTCAALSA
jgi:hypothetical protein